MRISKFSSPHHSKKLYIDLSCCCFFIPTLFVTMDGSNNVFSARSFCQRVFSYVSGVFQRKKPLPSRIYDLPNFDAGGDYCCPRQCFNITEITTECDGLACKHCDCWGICYCGCTSYMKWRAIKKKIECARKKLEETKKEECASCRRL